MYKLQACGPTRLDNGETLVVALVLLAAALLPLARRMGELPRRSGSRNRQLQEMVAEDATKALKQAKGQLEASAARSARRTPRGNACANRCPVCASRREAYGDPRTRRGRPLRRRRKVSRSRPRSTTRCTSNCCWHTRKASTTARASPAAIQAIEAARTLQPRGSTADTCLLINRGLLEHRQAREDLAIVTLTQAYRASIGPAVTEPHIMSADYLSLVMRSMGDYARRSRSTRRRSTGTPRTTPPRAFPFRDSCAARS